MDEAVNAIRITFVCPQLVRQITEKPREIVTIDNLSIALIDCSRCGESHKVNIQLEEKEN